MVSRLQEMLTEYNELDKLNLSVRERLFAPIIEGGLLPIRFTGFKPCPGDAGLVAQICWLGWNGQGPYAAVTIPSMRFQWYKKGEELEIGTERTYFTDADSKTIEEVKVGLQLLLNMVIRGANGL
jgi:hypothetical protein